MKENTKKMHEQFILKPNIHSKIRAIKINDIIIYEWWMHRMIDLN